MTKRLVLSLWAIPLWAQPVLPVASCPIHLDISGDWQFQPGDRAEFASPGIDDREWKAVKLPYTGALPTGYSWLRRTVELPAATNRDDLAISIGALNEVYEVFVNGTRVAAIGRTRLKETYIARPRVFDLPPGVVPAGQQKLLIALRLWNSGYRSASIRSVRSFPDHGPYLLTSRAVAPRNAAPLSMARRERSALPWLICGEVNFVLAAILLVVWLGHRVRKDLVLFAGFLFSEAWLQVFDYLSLVADWPHFANNFSGGISLFAGPLLLLYFMAAVSGQRLFWPRVFAGLVLALSLTAIVLTVIDDALVLGAEYFYFFNLTLLGLYALLALAALRVLWVAILGRIRNSILVAAIVLVVTILTIDGNVPFFGFLETATVVGGMGWSLHWVATSIVGFIMTVTLVSNLGSERQRLANELESARAVQQLLFPRAEAAGVDAAYVPASEVGGDFWQAVTTADGARLVMVGDVSGKGLKAAMAVSVLTGACRNRSSDEPARILGELNRVAASLLGRGGFATAVIALMRADRLTIANAGHPAPYIDGREVELEAGLPLGIDPEADYAAQEVLAGEQVTFVSDGVVEAENARRELFGFERTREVSTKSAQEIAEAAKAWGQNDDITVVTVRRSA